MAASRGLLSRSWRRFALPASIRADIASKTEAVGSFNVAGLLQGSDPTLSKEFVVMTAHPPVTVRRDQNQQILSKPVRTELLCSTVRSLFDRR